MKNSLRLAAFLFVFLVNAGLASAQSLTPGLPTWWAKYQTLLKHGAANASPADSALAAGSNEDASNECGPQSETFITLNHSASNILTAGSNEIFRNPMRGYFSSDSGATWGAVDVPLPNAIGGVNSFAFGSDPSLAYDTRGNVFYSFIVVYFSNVGSKNGINGTELAVARSSDGGQTYPGISLFSFLAGKDHFNDKPMITADTNTASPFRDNLYVAWVNFYPEAGPFQGSSLMLSRSLDGGAT